VKKDGQSITPCPPKSKSLRFSFIFSEDGKGIEFLAGTASDKLHREVLNSRLTIRGNIERPVLLYYFIDSLHL
jgi:hypothetical protein